MNDSPSATRILFVITKANWGGAQRYVYDLAIAAKEKAVVAGEAEKRAVDAAGQLAGNGRARQAQSQALVFHRQQVR